MEFGFPAAELVVVDESRSETGGAWGVAPAEGRPAVAPSRRWRRVFSAAPLKASARWGSPDLQVGGGGRRRRSPALVISGSFGLLRVQGPSCNFLFSCGPLCILGGTAVLRILVRCTCSCTHICTSLTLIQVCFAQKKTLSCDVTLSDETTTASGGAK